MTASGGNGHNAQEIEEEKLWPLEEAKTDNCTGPTVAIWFLVIFLLMSLALNVFVLRRNLPGKCNPQIKQQKIKVLFKFKGF